MNIAKIASDISRRSNVEQIAYLRPLVKATADQPRSHDFRVLQLMLQDRMTKQIKKQNAAERRRA